MLCSLFSLKGNTHQNSIERRCIKVTVTNQEKNKKKRFPQESTVNNFLNLIGW